MQLLTLLTCSSPLQSLKPQSARLPSLPFWVSAGPLCQGKAGREEDWGQAAGCRPRQAAFCEGQEEWELLSGACLWTWL